MLTKRDIEARLLRASKDVPADAHPLELSDLYQEYVTQGIKPSRIAEVVGKSRSFVGNMLRLLNLPDDALAAFEERQFTVTVAIEALKHAADDGDKAWGYIKTAMRAAGDAQAGVRHLPKHRQRPLERLSDTVLRFIARYDNNMIGHDDIEAFVVEAKALVVTPQVKRIATKAPAQRKRGIPS